MMWYYKKDDTMSETTEQDACKHIFIRSAQEMRQAGISDIRHRIWDEFTVGNVRIRLTTAWHNWQNEHKKWQYRE